MPPRRTRSGTSSLDMGAGHSAHHCAFRQRIGDGIHQGDHGAVVLTIGAGVGGIGIDLLLGGHDVQCLGHCLIKQSLLGVGGDAVAHPLQQVIGVLIASGGLHKAVQIVAVVVGHGVVVVQALVHLIIGDLLGQLLEGGVRQQVVHDGVLQVGVVEHLLVERFQLLHGVNIIALAVVLGHPRIGQLGQDLLADIVQGNGEHSLFAAQDNGVALGIGRIAVSLREGHGDIKGLAGGVAYDLILKAIDESTAAQGQAVAAVSAAAERNAIHGTGIVDVDGITVRCGIELGEANHDPAAAKEAALEPGLDFVLGSLHNLRGKPDFYDKAQKFALFTDTDGKHYTFEEYQTLIKDNQTDKDKNLIYLYANNKDEQFAYIEAAKNKGYNVLLMDGQLDVAMVSMLEQKLEKSRFTRVDSDVVDNLIVKEDKKSDVLEASKQEALSAAFKSQLPKMEKVEFNVMTQALGENGSPVMITQSEYMRRMKEMANIQAGMSFYGEMPDMFNLVLNSDHKLVKEVLADEEKECSAAIAPIQTELEDVTKRRDALKKKQEGKKDEDIPTVEKDELNDLDKKWDELKQQKDSIFAGYAGKNKVVRQLIDLALLQNNMLKGEALNNFVKRSIELI